jgi:hypothetical protein
MSSIEFKIEFVGSKEMQNMLAAAGAKAPQAIRRAINHTGDKAKTAMARAMAKQTGMKVSVMKRALKPLRASDGSATGFVPGKGSLEYVLRCKGGDVSLKYFRPVERGSGVYARPWGSQRFYSGAFTKSGPRGKRVANPKFHGPCDGKHLWRRVVRQDQSRSIGRVSRQGNGQRRKCCDVSPGRRIGLGPAPAA